MKDSVGRKLATCGALSLLLCLTVAASSGQVDRLQPISAEPAIPPCAGPLGLIYPESEAQPQIRANPRNADQLAVAWTQGGTLGGTYVGVSDDGGVSWSQHPVPISLCGGGDGNLATDAWIAWASDGTLYLTAVVASSLAGTTVRYTAAPIANAIAVTRSADGGRKWSQPVRVEDDFRKNDHPSIAVDPADPARLYVAWTKFQDDGRAAVHFSRSDDGGATWHCACDVIGASSHNIFQGGTDAPDGTAHVPLAVDLRVLPDGTLAVAFEYMYDPSRGDRVEEIALRSFDGGTTWAKTRIADTQGWWPGDPDFNLAAIGQPDMRFEVYANAAPSLAAGADGLLVVAWQDTTKDEGSIKFARSADAGATWSAPRVVRPASLGQAWGPTIAIDSDGVIAITWYDVRAEQPGDFQWSIEVWAATSDDGGQTWSELRLAGPFDLHTSVFVPPSFGLGNFAGLTAMSQGHFGAVFTMASPQATEPNTDVFFARFKPGNGPKRVLQPSIP
jgi:hypothetical protein